MKTVDTTYFINRNRELRRLVGRITNRGQCSALVGEPRVGKTSILHYLAAKTWQDNFGEVEYQLHFAYFDLQTIGSQFTQANFWEQAFYQLDDGKLFAPEKSISRAYNSCRESGFSTFMLERFLLQLGEEKIRLVLLLDEFDSLLFHPVLNRGEFFGSLRSLASRCDSLAMVIASRQSLSSLNTSTQELSRTGSPFFNIFEEITLGAFDEKTTQEFLSLSQKRLSSGDHKYLVRIAGGHPFFLQIARSSLLDEYEEKTKGESLRWQKTGERLLDQAKHIMDDTWRLWTPEMKQAFVTIALDEMPVILGEKQFDIPALVESLADLAPEVRSLKARGFIRDDKLLSSGFAVGAEVMLWWLADQLIIALRSNDELGAWLRSQQWDGTFFKKKEKDQLVKAAYSVGNFLKGGVETFITAAAEGVGKGISGPK